MVFDKTNLPTFSFDFDSTSYVVPSWSDLESACLTVARQVIVSQVEYDLIVTLAKGGWPMTRSLADFTGISEIASIGVKFYSGINQKEDKPIIYQDLPVEVEGKRVLLFDDVADSGDSLQFVKDLLVQRGVGVVHTATLYYKNHSIIQPDYYGDTISDWIIFPFEIIEMSQELNRRWLDQGVDPEVIKSKFEEMMFNSSIINLHHRL